MPRGKVEHFNTIIDYVILELGYESKGSSEDSSEENLALIDQLDLKKNNNAKKGTSKNTSEILKWMLDEGKVTNLFVSRADIPTENKDVTKFRQTAVFAVKIGVIQYILARLPEKDGSGKNPLEKKLLQIVESLLKQLELVLPGNNFSVQVYLLRKLKIIASDPKINVAPKTLSGYINDSLKIALKELEHNQADSTTPASLKDALEFFKTDKIFYSDETIKLFIEQTKKFYFNQNNYFARHLAFSGIINSWETLKDKLSLDDIEMLQFSAKNIAADYRNMPSRFRVLMGKIGQCLHVLDEYRAIIIGSSVFLGMMGSATYWIARGFQQSREHLYNNLSVMKNYQQTEEYQQLTQEQQQRIVSAIEFFTSQVPNLEQAKADNEFLGMVTSAFPVIVTGVALIIPFSLYHLNKPAAPSPVVLPIWVEEVKSKLLLNPQPNSSKMENQETLARSI